MNNPVNRELILSLMAAMPTPEEADALGIYDDVEQDGEVYSYKGESLGTVEERANQLWRREQWERIYSGEITEEQYEQMCEERG